MRISEKSIESCKKGIKAIETQEKKVQARDVGYAESEPERLTLAFQKLRLRKVLVHFESINELETMLWEK